MVIGSFSQSDSRFGSAAGIQCACNSLFALCWSVIRKVSLWQNYDLDHILIHGDKVYKFQNRNCTLSVDDLPSTIELENSVFHITKIGKFAG